MTSESRVGACLARSACFVLAFLAAFMNSCGSIESKRIQELLVKKGFGKRAEGDAQAENYATTGSTIQFFVPMSVLSDPSFGDLLLLAQQPQTVAVDGTIYIPGYGATQVLGLSERKIAALVTEQLQAFYSAPIQIEARLLDAPKFYYVIGEVFGLGPVPFVGDMTIAEAFFRMPRTPLANIGKIRVIRGDPRNPLVVTVNMWDIALYGVTTYNINIKENDIIYVPPTFFGSLARFLEKLISPFTTLVQALFTVQNLRWNYQVLTGDAQGGIFWNPYIF